MNVKSNEDDNDDIDQSIKKLTNLSIGINQTNLISNKVEGDHPFILIEDMESVKSMIDKLSKYKEIAFDCEGVDLSRSGPLTLASFIGCAKKDDNDDENNDEEIVYIVDVKKIDHKILFPKSSTNISLKTILESSEYLKVMFDSRADSDALFHQFGVKLYNVLDLQVYDQGCRIANGERPPAPSNGWIPFVKGMKSVMINYIPYDTRKKLGEGIPAPHSNNSQVWGKRPLSENSLKYASDDVYIIKYMLKSMNDRHIPDDLMNAVIIHSNKRVGQLRDSVKEIVWSTKNKRIFMEEHPIVPSTYRVPASFKAVKSTPIGNVGISTINSATASVSSSAVTISPNSISISQLDSVHNPSQSNSSKMNELESN